MRRSVYMDHNATAPICDGVAEAVAEAVTRLGNPSSVHRAGRLVRRIVEDSRDAVAALTGAHAGDIVFTSGGSEANALALGGTDRRRILVSAVEHTSVLAAASETVPVDADGVIDIAALDAMLGEDPTPALVSVMAANNETGVRQPIGAVAAVARRHDAIVHTDAVQAAGRQDLDMDSLGVHMLSLSAHKMGGPLGVGALVVAPTIAVAPAIRGGGQERGRRAGTENVSGIAGFGVAAQVAVRSAADGGRFAGLRDRLEDGIARRVPAARFFGRGVDRLDNTTCVAMPGVDNETQVMAFDQAGFAISAGAACSSGKIGSSHVLAAMGVDAATAASAIRVSLGAGNEATDVDAFVDAWTALHARLGAGGETELPAA